MRKNVRLLLRNCRLAMFVIQCFITLAVLVCAAGCYTFDKTKTIIRTDQTRIEWDGPGMEDGVAYRLEKCEYKNDDGSRLSVGLFPGMDDFCSRKNGVSDHVGATVLFNLLWVGIPTIASLFYDPLFPNESGVAQMGLLGAYRWRVEAHEKRDKVVASEMVIVPNAGSLNDSRETQVVQLKDGQSLLVVYPGFDQVKKGLSKSDHVDVLHFNGDKIRRFAKSSLNECSLKFEDRHAEDEPSSVKRKMFLSECAKLKTRIGNLRINYGQDVNESRLREMENAIATKEKRIGWDWFWTRTIANDLMTEEHACERNRIARKAEEGRSLAAKREFEEQLRIMKSERLCKPYLLMVCGFRFGEKNSNGGKSLPCSYGPFSNVLIKTDDNARIRELIFWDWTSFQITMNLSFDPGEANTPGPVGKFQSLRTVNINIPISGGKFPDENSAHVHLDKEMREFIKMIESEYEIKLGYRTGGFLGTRLGDCSTPRHGRYCFNIEYSSHPPGENIVSWTYKSFKNALASPLKSAKDGLEDGTKLYYWFSIRDMGDK